jgi:hypothetical protein
MANGAIKRIHVNQHIIRRNRREATSDPPLTVKVRGQNLRAERVEIAGPAIVVYSPQKPLSCGATVWVETRGAVVVHTRSAQETVP